LAGRIAITRAFGDLKLKEPTPFITAEPDLKQQWLTPRDAWLVLGSDGMWDYVTEHDAREWCTKVRSFTQ
jgi:protein phosphatase 1L